MSNPYLFGRIDAGHLPVPSAGRQAIPAFNLWEQLELLHTSVAWRTGVARKTLARYPEFRIDLVALAPQATIQRHANAGRISLQCVTGLVRLVTDGRTFSLPAGEVLILGHGIWHSVEAERESAILITVALPHADVPALFNAGRWVLPDDRVAVLAQ